MHVVRDEDEGAFVAFEGEGEGFDGLDVEVGGGFVHQQEVGRVDEELDQVESAFFAAAEDGGGFEQIFLAELEGAEEGPGIVFAEGGGTEHDFFEDGAAGGEQAGAVLAEVADLGVVPEFAFSFLDVDHSGKDFEEGGFSGAVGPHQNGAFASFHDQVETGVHRVMAIGEMDALQGDGALAAARGRGDLNADGFARGDGFFDPFHPFDLFELGHGLGGLGRNGTEAVSKFLERLDFLLLVFMGGQLAFVAFLALAEEVGVIAFVGDQTAFGDFVHLVDDFVHELPVMGDHEESAGIAFEVVLEPEQGEEIQVVGGFVEEEEVGFDDQQSGEVGAHDPAAAEVFGGPIEVGFLEAETGEEFFGLGFDLRIIEGLMLGMGFEVFVGGGIAQGFQFAETTFEFGQVSGPAGSHFHDRFVADRLGFLGEVADHGPGVAFDLTGVRFGLLEDEGEEGGLAGAVGADQGDAFAVIDLERRVFEQRASAQNHFEISNCQHEGPVG